MRNNFKVGDRVQFKSWEEMAKEFGVICGDIPCRHIFTSEMKHLCGTYATIISITGKKVDLQDFTAEGDLEWKYSTDMIKPVTSEPKRTFTEDEKVILRNIREEFRWIARDRDGGLNIYNVKPYKLDNCWGRKRIIDFEIFNVFEHLFKSIKWEDDTACEFGKYI